MQVDSDVLLARIRADFPTQYELAVYRCLVDSYRAENQALKTQLDARAQTDTAAPLQQADELGGGHLYPQEDTRA